jgi:hypothetical protein
MLHNKTLGKKVFRISLSAMNNLFNSRDSRRHQVTAGLAFLGTIDKMHTATAYLSLQLKILEH